MMENNSDKEPAYDVGYGKTPVHTRFKPGQSGNAKGRKKGTLSLKEDILRELNSKITIREGDKEIRITRQQAMVKTLTARSIKGDRHAVQQMLVLMARVIGMEGADGPTAAEMSAADKAIIESFYKRNIEEKKQ